MSTKIDSIKHNKELKRKKIMSLFDIPTIKDFNSFVKKYNIVYDYFAKKNQVTLLYLKRVIYFTKHLPKEIKFKSIVHYKNNYYKGILPTLYKLSAISYRNDLVCSLGIISSYVIKNTNKLYVLLYVNDTLFIVFRGTKYFNELKKGVYGASRVRYNFEKKDTHQKFLDWKEDFLKNFSKTRNKTDVPEINHRNLYVHKEYYAKSKEVIKQLRVKINSLRKNRGLKNIIATGHSMGGSLSMICGVKLKEIYGNKVKINIVSFSNLGVGNRNLSLFSVYLGINSYIRVYNKTDLVDLYRSGILFKFTGRLRHLNHSFTKKYSNHYIREDIDQYIPEKLIDEIQHKKRYKKLYLNHILYKFSKNKDAPIYI